MSKTKIEWAEMTWNVVTGCDPVSEGCKNCYARRMARRLAGRYGYPKAPHHFDVTLHLDRLDVPLRRKKPTTYFVCSMSDLFHEDISTPFIADLWDIMAEAHQHTFQILTKRVDRLPEVFHYLAKWKNYKVPLSNIWLGVSVENQATADKRTPILLQIPAAVRFVSCEPLLEAINLKHYLDGMPEPYGGGHRGYVTRDMAIDAEDLSLEGANLGWQEPEWQQTALPLDWVICGGEAGPSARPMRPNGVRGLRNQCQTAGVPFFFKQWGGWIPNEAGWGVGHHFHSKHIYLNSAGESFDGWMESCGEHIAIMAKVSRKAAGRLLDGREWNEMPVRK